MKTELFIEKLIEEGRLNREELDELIAVEQAKNPVPALQQAVARAEEDAAFLLYGSMVAEFRMDELEQSNADLTYMMMMG